MSQQAIYLAMTGLGATMDRMTAATFEMPESQFKARKSIKIHLEEVDGTVADLEEKAPLAVK